MNAAFDCKQKVYYKIGDVKNDSHVNIVKTMLEI